MAGTPATHGSRPRPPARPPLQVSIVWNRRTPSGRARHRDEHAIGTSASSGRARRGDDGRPGTSPSLRLHGPGYQRPHPARPAPCGCLARPHRPRPRPRPLPDQRPPTAPDMTPRPDLRSLAREAMLAEGFTIDLPADALAELAALGQGSPPPDRPPAGAPSAASPTAGGRLRWPAARRSGTAAARPALPRLVVGGQRRLHGPRPGGGRGGRARGRAETADRDRRRRPPGAARLRSGPVRGAQHHLGLHGGGDLPHASRASLHRPHLARRGGGPAGGGGGHDRHPRRRAGGGGDLPGLGTQPGSTLLRRRRALAGGRATGAAGGERAALARRPAGAPARGGAAAARTPRRTRARWPWTRSTSRRWPWADGWWSCARCRRTPLASWWRIS